MTLLQFTRSAIGAAILSGGTANAAHVAAGVTSSPLGNVLAFYDELETELGPVYTLLTSTRPITLTLQTSGALLGYWRADSDTYFALALESPLSAPAGSFVDMFVTNITGPEGGIFSYFESGSATPTFSLVVGETPDALDSFRLSDTFPITPTSDPFGHIHGRRMAFNQPGDYTITYVLRDRSGQVADSAPMTVSYSGVPEPGVALSLIAGVAVLVFHRRLRGA
jgi:hypothetical protein